MTFKKWPKHVNWRMWKKILSYRFVFILLKNNFYPPLERSHRIDQHSHSMNNISLYTLIRSTGKKRLKNINEWVVTSLVSKHIFSLLYFAHAIDENNCLGTKGIILRYTKAITFAVHVIMYIVYRIFGMNFLYLNQQCQ